jgi:predicted peptidase
MTLMALVVFLGSLSVSTAEPVRKKIVLVGEAKNVTKREIQKAAGSESEKNPDGGYNAHVTVVDCFAAMEYRYTGGRYVDEPIRFRLLCPDEIKPGKTYPLVLWFHGKGESGEDNTRQLSHVQSTVRFLAGKEKLEFFLLATQCPTDNPYWETTVAFDDKGDAPMTIADEILDAVLEEYPIDKNRLGVFGLCSGGNAAWEYVNQYPGRFASLVVCSSSPKNENPESFVKTAVWAFNNEDDTVPFDHIERFIEKINESGGNAFLTLNKTGGHDAWSGALNDSRVIGWMLLQSLDHPSPPQGVLCHHRTQTELFFLFTLPLSLIVILVLGYAGICWK